jgi:hypothetical protein
MEASVASAEAQLGSLAQIIRMAAGLTFARGSPMLFPCPLRPESSHAPAVNASSPALLSIPSLSTGKTRATSARPRPLPCWPVRVVDPLTDIQARTSCAVLRGGVRCAIASSSVPPISGALVVAASIVAAIRLRGGDVRPSPMLTSTIRDSVILAEMVLAEVDGRR